MLTPAAIARVFPIVRSRMGRNAVLVDKLISLVQEDGNANLAHVLESLYPGEEREKAQANLRQLRLEISRAAAKKPEVKFVLDGDSKTRSTPEERSVWFEGEDRAAESLQDFNAPNIKRVDPVWVPQDAIKEGPAECYIVYAAKDKGDAENLIEFLRPYCTKAGVRIWTDAEILPGENPDEQRAQACRRADIALLFVSPEFECDDGIQHVLARLEELNKRMMPVQLHETADPHPNTPFRTAKGQAFDACRRKPHFALDLFKALRAKLTKQLDIPESGHRPDYFVEGDAAPASLEREPGAEINTTPNRGSAIGFLREWLFEKGGPPYCALLGELGMGKTTTAKELTRQLEQERAAGLDVPQSIFFDLRYVRDLAITEPDLDAILAQLLRLSWKGGAKVRIPSVNEIHDAVSQGALIIFDGLDEVLGNLSDAQGQMFTRQLFRALPPDAPKGKLLITCRTHFFRNVKHESAHFTTEGRDHVKAETYRALVLLPFKEEQIQQYLTDSLGEADGTRAFGLIQTIHNLPELAERPYMLSLIRGQFGKLERWKAEGRRVTGLTLYRFFVEEWLVRDSGKHQLIPEHKQRMMEHIAAALVRQKQRSWDAEQLEDWLLEFLELNPKIQRRYFMDTGSQGRQSEARQVLLMEDLRTATFLVRAGDQFRFAHTSLQEYFLSVYLRRALEEDRADDWVLTGVSPETLDFLGQSLEERRAPEAQACLVAMRDSYRKQASELAFRFFIVAHAKGYPVPSARGFQLPGANLWEVEVNHKGPNLLDLSGINLRGADLGNTFWNRCSFLAGDFQYAKAQRSEWRNCEMLNSNWRNADLEGVMFRKPSDDGANFENANLYRTSGLSRDSFANAAKRVIVQTGHQDAVLGCAWSKDGRRVLSASADNTLKIWDATSGHRLLTLEGHQNGVMGCAWSSDINGTRVLSASIDNTLKIWDAASGHCLLTFEGHHDAVCGCAWSSDSTRVLSASADNTLKIWDANSGHCLLTLEGHQAWVMGCAWSSDIEGTRVLSASSDKSLKIWDADSGCCLLTLEGHQDGVRGCAWSRDNTRVLSASDDQTLKIWDAHTGRCLLTLEGHQSWVRGCAWSNDDTRVLSSSLDQTLKIWDVGAGRCLLTLEGHQEGVSSCTWSCDGTRVLAASHDQTLKIWEVDTGRCLLTLEGHQSWVRGCAWSNDGTRVLSAAWDKSVKIWDGNTGRCALILEGHQAGVSGCAWSSDGTRVLSTSDDNTLKIWDADIGNCLLTLEGHQNVVWGCAWSNEGTRVLSASDDNSLKIWDATSGHCLLTLAGHQNGVRGCAWSNEGARVLSASDDKTLKIWDAVNGRCLLTLEGHQNGVLGGAWSIDATRILSASYDKTLKIWRADSGRCLLTLKGHQAWVNGYAWSSDGTRVLSTSHDKTIKIWDTESGRCLLTRALPASARNLALSPDGKRVLIATVDGLCQYAAETLEEIGPRLYHLHPPHSEPTWAAVDHVNNKIVAAGPGAWRSLGWVVPEPPTGLPMYLPAEAFGQDFPD